MKWIWRKLLVEVYNYYSNCAVHSIIHRTQVHSPSNCMDICSDNKNWTEMKTIVFVFFAWKKNTLECGIVSTV